MLNPYLKGTVSHNAFKVGYNQVWEDGIIVETFKAGRKEVVDWIMEKLPTMDWGAALEWRGKLEEWGFSEEYWGWNGKGIVLANCNAEGVQAEKEV